MELPTLFFEDHPNPMLIFDTDTLEILEVNESATKKYGFSRDDFIQLTIEDIRPAEDIPEMRKELSKLDKEAKNLDLGTFRHKTKDGEILYVQISTQMFPMDNREARIVHVHDLTETIELKQEVEEAYRDQRQHIENNPLGMVKFDKNFRVIEWSKRAEEKTGYAKEEIVGTFVFEGGLFSEDESDFIRERMAKISSGEIGKDRFETRIRLKNGEPMDVLVHVSALRDQQGQLKSVLAFIEDITDYKYYRQELEAEQKRLKRAQRLARIGWWSYEIKDNRVIWSDVLFDIMGVEEQEFEGTFEAFYELVHPDDRAKLEDIMARAPQTDNPLDYMLRIVKPNDEVIHTKCRAQSQFNSDGEMVQLSGVLQDITSKKKAQDELRRNKELFESLFLNSPVAIVMIDVDGKVQKINQSFGDLFGYTEDELIGKDLLAHQLPKDRYDEIDEIYEHVFSDEGRSKYYEDQRITKNGKTKDLLVGALPVVLEGEPIAAFGIYTDITELRRTQQNLEDSLQEKEVLLSEIHHRVKNNLAIISGLLLLEAMNWDDDSAVSKVLMQSKLRIHSMAKIHEKLYESNDFANLNLEDYISELVETISDSLKGPENVMDVEVDCDNVVLNINQALPCALIINELVTNSFKYAFEDQQKGELAVQFKSQGGQISIIVEDTGLGLPDSFDAMTEKSLGHRLVSQLVKQLDGEIDVQSDEVTGTRYEIKFEKKEKSGSASNYFV